MQLLYKTHCSNKVQMVQNIYKVIKDYQKRMKKHKSKGGS